MKKIQQIVSIAVLALFMLTSCKDDAKKTDANKAAITTQKVNLSISGMTCEIGCAKTIESKLSKKEGITSAKVSFKDSLATVKFDAAKISKKEVMAYVESIGGGDLYKVTETDKEVKTCGPDCKKPCCTDKKSCDKDGKKCDHKTKEECKEAGCKDKKDCKKDADCKDKKDCKKGASCDKKDCDKKDCKKGASCDKKDAKKTCKPDCKKACCADKKA